MYMGYGAHNVLLKASAQRSYHEKLFVTCHGLLTKTSTVHKRRCAIFREQNSCSVVVLVQT